MSAPGVAVESCAQLVVRISSGFRPSLKALDLVIFPDDGPYEKRLIEITGDSNSGKSLLLIEIIARAILPPQFGGRGSDAVFFDLDHKFPLLQLMRAMEKVITSSESTKPSELKDIVESSLNHLHIYDCYSEEEFRLALIALDKVLFTNKDVSLVAVDSICAFYWLDCKEKTIKMENHYKTIVGKLRDLCMEYAVVGMYTRPSYYASNWNGKPLVDYIFKLIPFTPSHEVAIRQLELSIPCNGKTFNSYFTINDFGFKFSTEQ